MLLRTETNNINIEYQCNKNRNSNTNSSFFNQLKDSIELNKSKYKVTYMYSKQETLKI
ncbi:hypothetical protein DFH91_002871 [Clostridium saccharobutylicum]|uniref:hypothetical protein n=1 Tax=Clostridium saccharobutylicum TaxID=169679 RepID=UPI001494F1B4|nr:hypothetical protein [Clostridium saccharobutylicum]NOV85381.1 hypothetical protein [Clostridium saccharobutylicum]